MRFISSIVASVSDQCSSASRRYLAAIFYGVRAAVVIAMTPLLFIEYLYNQPLTTRSSE